jgi:crotonobetainyl-CoA:carnitine CoA-transferase CaiB-like acyl-CoA transferase
LKPLAGIKVLDLSRVLAGPWCTQLLADLGAEVIKIEPPSRGDATRLIGGAPGFNDSGLHRRWNRGKKSVAIDTRNPAGIEIIKRLIPTVDLVIEGLRPGTLEKMGLSWPVLTALKPNLVMVSLSGYGQTGPYRDMPSHGVAFDAISGLAGVEHDENGHPRVAPRHVYYGGLVGPLFGATSALAALSWSRRTGRPVFLDVAQADTAAFANYAVEQEAAQRRAVESGAVKAPPPAPQRGAQPASTMQAYRTGDGKLLMLMALERKFFLRLAEATGRNDLLAHIGDEYMVRGTKEIDQALRETIASKDIEAWMEIFAGADVPVVPVNESAEVADDPQMRARIEWMDSDQGTVTMKTPVRSDPAMASPQQAPSIGQHTAEILARVDIAPSELERLEKDAVIRVGPKST